MGRIIRAAAREFKASGFTAATTGAMARNADVTGAQPFRYSVSNAVSKAALFRESVFKPLNPQSVYFRRGAAPMTTRITAQPRVNPRLMVRVSSAAVLDCLLFRDRIFPPGLASDEQIGCRHQGISRGRPQRQRRPGPHGALRRGVSDRID